MRVSRFSFLILAALISLSAILSAQIPVQTDALNQPNSNQPIPDQPDPAAVQPSTPIQPLILPENLPENPKPHRVIDKKFIFVMGALGGLESMRFTTRQLVLENEMSAGAPWVTSVPSHSHLVLKYAPIFAAELLVAYEIKKPHDWLPGDKVIRKLWWLYPLAMGAIHLHNALGNIHTQGAAGCRSVEECQQQP